MGGAGTLRSATSGRPLPLRVRPDLRVERHLYQGGLWYAVKEPLGLKCQRLRAEDFFVLQSLDGHRSLDDVQEAFAARFLPHTIADDELLQLLDLFTREGLVILESPGQGPLLNRRRRQQRRQEFLSAVMNLFCLRFRGLDPDRLLAAMHPWLRWIYTPWAVAATVLLGLAALLWITVQFDAFQARLPDYQQFFTPDTALMLMAVLAATKILHELGHGLTCKHFGGECHELGVMLLVLTPCLYCDVSDSAMLPNKWKRIAIAAGGMYVELALASVATFLWWFSQPGLLHNLCLATMFVCSVSTLVFNANPLMRYDGYYILADLLEIPNLRQDAAQTLHRKLGEWLLRIEFPEDPYLPKRRAAWFALFTVASAVYRWIVTFSILWFLCQFFAGYKVKVIGQTLGLISLAMLVGLPIWKTAKFFWIPGRTELVDPLRMRGCLIWSAIVVLALWLIPLPHHVMCTVEIEPHDAESVYAEAAGTLEEILVRPGEQVAAGQVLARLSNVDIDLAVSQRKQECDQLAARLRDLRRQRFTDAAAGSQIAALEESWDAARQQWQRKRVEQERLTLVARSAGMIMPPPSTAERRGLDGRPLGWSGTPLDRANAGCLLEEGRLFCQIGDREKLKAHLVIDQQDIDFVAEGQAVSLKIDLLPHQTLSGTIEKLARVELKVSPRQLSNKAGGELATKTDPSGVERPLNVSYEADLPLSAEQSRRLRPGLRGRAKIHTAGQSIGRRAWRFFQHTFHFKL